MKKQILSIGCIILILSVGFSGCVFPDQGYVIERVDETPDNYINFSYDRLRYFLTLKKAILNYNERDYISAPIQELNQVQGIFIFHNTNYFLYNGTFYEIGFYSAD